MKVNQTFMKNHACTNLLKIYMDINQNRDLILIGLVNVVNRSPSQKELSLSYLDVAKTRNKEIKKWMKKRKTQCQNGPAKPSANGDNWMRCNICLLVAQEEYSTSHIRNHHKALHEKVISFEVLKKTPQLEKKKHRSNGGRNDKSIIEVML